MPVPVAVKQSVLHAAKKKRSPSFSHNRRILQPSASTVIHEVTHEHTIEHVHDHSDHEDDNESLVIEELTAAQGTLAVISALLASFSFAGLIEMSFTGVANSIATQEAAAAQIAAQVAAQASVQVTKRSWRSWLPFVAKLASFLKGAAEAPVPIVVLEPPLLHSLLVSQSTLLTLYHVTTSLSIAMQLFVCILCTTLEQQGKVARGLSMARKNHGAKHRYDEQLHDWYTNPAFARFRTEIIHLFLLSTPLFAFSLSLLCLLTITAPHAYIPAFVFAAMGLTVLWYLLWLMDLFRKGVLGGAGINDTVVIGEDSNDTERLVKIRSSDGQSKDDLKDENERLALVNDEVNDRMEDEEFFGVKKAK
jgi:hypothetical protein